MAHNKILGQLPPLKQSISPITSSSTEIVSYIMDMDAKSQPSSTEAKRSLPADSALTPNAKAHILRFITRPSLLRIRRWMRTYVFRSRSLIASQQYRFCWRRGQPPIRLPSSQSIRYATVQYYSFLPIAIGGFWVVYAHLPSVIVTYYIAVAADDSFGAFHC